MRPNAVLCSTLLGLVLIACGPANDRPLRGAVPGTSDPAPTQPGLPPTLTPSDALRFRPLPSPSPAVVSAAASPSPSVVAAPPIVRTIAPGANAHVPAGAPVTLSAVLVGRGADLSSTSLAVDGADSGAAIDKRTAREWTIHATQALRPGPHSARVLVRDADGSNGGFTWQFTVGEDEPEPKPAPGPSPAPKP